MLYTSLVQVNKSILLFKHGLMQVFKMEKLDTNEIVATSLPSLCRTNRQFAVTNFQNKQVFVSGGFNAGIPQSDVFIFDIELEQWERSTPMNHARCDHASCTLD